MFAELHLAEDAFALHSLLQYLEGLVDIVVSDENLHVVYPSIDPNGQGDCLRTANATEPYSIQPLTGSEKARQCKVR